MNQPATTVEGFHIRTAASDDVELILEFIRELAVYEKLPNEVTATPDDLRESLFGEHPGAEILIGEYRGTPVAFALFFHNYSTFLGRRGIYLEDLYVRESMRGKGFGRCLLSRLAQIAGQRSCGRLEWSVLNWNAPAIGFYRSLGAIPMEQWTSYRLTGEPLAKLAGCCEA